MLGQFRSPRTGRLYRDASPGARYERRYTMSLYCSSTLPRDKKKCWNTPRKQLALTNAQLGTRQLKKRCGEIVNRPCGEVEALYHLRPFIHGFHSPRGRKQKCLQRAKLEVLNMTVYTRYSAAFPPTTCANLLLQYREAIAHGRLSTPSCRLQRNRFKRVPPPSITASPSLVGRWVSCTRDCAKSPK